MDPLNKGSRDVSNLAKAPGRQAREVKSQVRRAVNAPVQEARQLKMRAQRLQRAPGQQARRMKNQILRPLQGVGRSLGTAGAGFGAGQALRRYKRKPDRLASTDFTVSAMLYPFAMILSLFAGMVADWDTAFIRYHLAHARVLAVIAWIFTLIAIPLAIALLLADYAIIAVIPLVFLFILWAYAWFLGFQAYSGKITIIPLITNYLESRNKLDFDTLEKAFNPE